MCSKQKRTTQKCWYVTRPKIDPQLTFLHWAVRLNTIVMSHLNSPNLMGYVLSTMLQTLPSQTRVGDVGK